MNVQSKVERWGLFELKLRGPSEGNPGEEVSLSAGFTSGSRYGEAEGFYDGDGTYRIRFMPQEEGTWTYRTQSSAPELDGLTGQFVCAGPSGENRGPVRTRGEAHFAYADGTRFIPVGTVCSQWHLQDGERRAATLEALRASGFNKVRMSVLPLSGELQEGVPEPFGRHPDGRLDVRLLQPEYFRMLEERINELTACGIEAELVLLHPGALGAEDMSTKDEERYVRHCIARFGACAGVWWSAVEEPEGFAGRTPGDWNRLLRLIAELDCGGHLRSVRSRPGAADFGSPWATHISLDTPDVKAASDYTRAYGKPVLIDSAGSEGNLDRPEASLTPEEMVSRLWEGAARGGYVSCGEAYEEADGGRIWRTHGGKPLGKSAARAAFLRRMLEELPDGMRYNSDRYDAATLEVRGECYLQYFGPHRFAFRGFELPEGRYTVDLIDTWQMTVEPLPGEYEGRFRIDLPVKENLALRIRRLPGALSGPAEEERDGTTESIQA
ncbi:DUF5060 domain-containing protein [Paenibacillus mucilaginosus]|uniref:DUF5060 domain-containing protein n=1 Tax=Paenibacillus mucilaginosus (strain KNP414) TaxID=1036673 RepID=F8FG06_PAEMK|nr:DUF5060 domain-containing protein [Paenibacillus mucilaginosus]AEI43268.1 hypothetical protein KNP414_04738 [Paenibacillus mucilaginosus KNP414]MCG7212177.1 DUF5060 domain-containing protein [Paenibacillus mucilaginosus]WDM24853.1 DUF5060 domain-containing protein [Paenibacillus mucilaginosus]